MSVFRKTVSFILSAAMIISMAALTPFTAFAQGENVPETASELILDEPQLVEIVSPGDCAYFSFTPEETLYYEFFSESDLDPSCILFDSDMEIISENDDCEDSDFSLKVLLTAGETYYFCACLWDLTGEFYVTLRVYDGIVVEQDIVDVEVEPGESATLTAEAFSNSGELTYQWYKFEDGEEEPAAIEGATESVYETGEVNLSAVYVCEISDGENTAEIYYNVTIASGIFADAAGDPDFLVDPGETVTLEVVAGADVGGVYYQWYGFEYEYDGENDDYIEVPVPIEGETGSSYTTGEITENKQFICEVKDDFGNAVSVFFTVSISNDFTAYAKDGEAVYVENGGTAVLEVEASTGSGEISYQWFRGVPTDAEFFGTIWFYEEIPEETGSSLTVEDVTGRMEFYCAVSDEFGNSEEVSFSVFVENGFSVEAAGEPSIIVKPGDDAVLEVNATVNEGDLTCVWYKQFAFFNGEQWDGDFTILDDETDLVLSLENIETSAVYFCVVTDEFGNTDSVMFEVVVDTGFTVNTPEQVDIAVTAGESAALTVDAEVEDGPLYYFWTVYDESAEEYVLIEGENSASLELEKVSGSAEYVCLVTDAYGNYKEISFSVKVKSGLTVVNPYNELHAEPGDTLEITAEAYSSDGSEISYVWEAYGKVYNEETESWDYVQFDIDETGSTITVENIDGTRDYLCIISDENGSSEIAWFTIYVDGDLVVNTPAENTVSVYSGESAILSVDAVSSANISYAWRMIDPDYVSYPDAKDSTFTTEAITEDSIFICAVTDALGNTKTVRFYVTVDGEAPVHEFGAPEWVWAEDFSSAAAAFTCVNEPDHVETVEAVVTAEETAPACETDGSVVYTASVEFEGETYNDVKTAVVPAAGHTPKEAVKENEKEATCKEEGSYDSVVYCEVCGKELGRETVVTEKKAHTPGEAVKENEVPAACAENGSYDSVVYCSVCGEEISRESVSVEKTGHVWGEWTKADENQHQRVCAADASHVEKADHEWDEGVVTKAATTKDTGIKTYTCAVCKATKTETIDKLPITADPDFMLGDINLDKEITAEDARLALRQAVKLEHYAESSINFINGDVNFDGSITADDARSILRAAVKLESPSDWLKNMPK